MISVRDKVDENVSFIVTVVVNTRSSFFWAFKFKREIHLKMFPPGVYV